MNLMRKIRFGYPWMILWAIGVHILWAVALLIRPSIVNLVILVGLNRFTDSGLSPSALAVILILAASSALIGLSLEDKVKPRTCLLMLMSQYFLMIAAMLSDMEVIINSRNPMTGTHIDRVLLITLLGPMVLAAFLHTASILERFVFRKRYVYESE